MDTSLEECTSLLRIQREIDDMKDSIELAHQNNIKTQTQVGGFASNCQNTEQRLSNLEREATALKGYVRDLENYCISLDTVLRKHHLLVSGVPEDHGESANLAAFRVLQICFQDISATDIDYCFRIGAPPPPPAKLRVLRLDQFWSSCYVKTIKGQFSEIGAFFDRLRSMPLCLLMRIFPRLLHKGVLI